MARIIEQVSMPSSADAEPTSGSGTRLAIHSKRTLGAGFVRLMEQRIDAALRGLGSRIPHTRVSFEDLNGPKRGVDTACRIQLKLSGEPPLVVEGRGEDENRAFRVALPRLIAALDRQLSRRAAQPRTTLRVPVAQAS